MSMAGFSSATLERIRAASDIVDVIGACLPLTELPTPNSELLRIAAKTPVLP